MWRFPPCIEGKLDDAWICSSIFKQLAITPVRFLEADSQQLVALITHAMLPHGAIFSQVATAHLLNIIQKHSLMRVSPWVEAPGERL